MYSSSANPPFDVLTTTANDLRLLLEEGSITSRKIVETYLNHIEKHNVSGAKCRAVVSSPPTFLLMDHATRLDKERAEGKIRGPLHGIPILIKDSIATGPSLAMPTTVGSYALQDLFPSDNADIINNLIDQGLVILGKTNMTEFLGKKGISGWSAVGGMCQPAYIPTGYKLGKKRRGESTPAGSSTGSAVGVACGFSPIALGIETSGSIVSPAAVAALYALKLTPGKASLKGVFHLTSCFDTVGAMGKTAFDVALACDALLSSRTSQSLAAAATSAKWQNMSVGFVDIEQWRLPADTQVYDENYQKQTAREYAQAMMDMRSHGARVVQVYITPPEEYMVGDNNVDDLMDIIINYQSKNGFERYLKALEFSRVRTLEEIITFNEEHGDLEFDKDYCPGQGALPILVEKAKPDDEMQEFIQHCKRWAATEGIDKAVSEHGVDIVLCPSDSFFAGVSVGSQYPMAAVPLGYIESSGRPYGLQAVSKANQESKLVEFMAAWESTSLPRRLPDLDKCAKHRGSL